MVTHSKRQGPLPTQLLADGILYAVPAEHPIHPSLLILTLTRPHAGQVSEALSIISSHDFPTAWPTLLPELVSKLSSGDAGTVNGVLLTAASIFERCERIRVHPTRCMYRVVRALVQQQRQHPVNHPVGIHKGGFLAEVLECQPQPLNHERTIIGRYRGQYMTQGLNQELEYSQNFVKPLLDTFRGLRPQASVRRGLGKILGGSLF